MSEVVDEGAFTGRSAVEAKLAEAGADQVRRHSFADAPEAAPEGTPAETVSADQPRNELGQFASTEPEQAEHPEQIEEPEAAAETPEEQAQGDPAVAALLAKYGGDVDKALNAAVHAQRRLGELGNELGQERQQNAEYEQMISELRGLREDFAQQRQQAPIDQGTVDWFDEQVLANPQGAVEYARQQNNNILFQRGLAAWKEMQPYEAAVYTNNLNNQAMYQQLQQQVQANSQLPADANMHMALQNVRATHPEYVNYDDAIGDTLTKYPFMQKVVNDAYASGDREQLEGALETLYGLAQRDTLASIALTGNTPETTTASTEVAEPTISETHTPPPPPSQTELWRQQFRETAEREQKGIWVAD